MHRRPVVLVAFALLLFVLGCTVERRSLQSFGGAAGVDGNGGNAGSGAIGGDAGVNGGVGGTGGEAGQSGTDGAAAQGGSGGGCTSTSCDDDLFCNGLETCGSDGQCLRGAPPCPSTACDEQRDVCDTSCSHDADSDGYVSTACGGSDCDDNNASVNPDGFELCNSVDDNCNGDIDDSYFFVDCLAPNTGLSVCLAGQCAITLCARGYLDCDQLHSNGCEVRVNPALHDCLKNTCTGIAADPTDTPEDDDNECTYERCSGTTPETGNVANGTPCHDDEGQCDNGFCLLSND